MKVEAVKAKIEKKFGSLNRFCNTANLNYQNVNNVFRKNDSPFKQQELRDLSKLCEKTSVRLIDGRDLTPQLIEKIRKAIRVRYNTYDQFCEQHKFSNSWLSALLNGRHKLISAKIKRLCAILEIDYAKSEAVTA